MPEGGTITYVYDSDGRLTQENHKDKNGEISNCITYAYDYAGNLISRTDSEGNATSITHDLMDREISVTAPDGGTLLRSYDKNGNLSWEVLPQENVVAGIWLYI